MEILFGILSMMSFQIVFEFSRAIFTGVREVYFPSRRGAPGRWARFGWSIGPLAGFAAGAVSLSLAPERVARGAIANGLVWFTLPLVCGVLALLVEALRRTRRAELFDAFVAGALFALAYLAIRLAIPAPPGTETAVMTLSAGR